MPSFYIVSEVNSQEITNAVDQANREVSNRFDFKGSNAEFKLTTDVITLVAPNEFQLKQMLDILTTKTSKRGVDIRHLDIGKPQTSLHQATQEVKVKQGIDQDAAEGLVKIIKDSSLKVQASIQGDKVRITGKKKDDLQQAIALMRQEDLKIALRLKNFRE